jgi:hypothetical protein
MTEPEKKSAAMIIGLTALALVIVLLLSTPSEILAREVQLIDTELGRASGNEIYVFTKMDFGSNEHVQTFPREIGSWRSVSYNISRLAERLNADTMLLRVYANLSNGTLRDKPVSFSIIQSENLSTFHPPPICYGGLGYKIEAETTEEVLISNTTWARPPLTSASGHEHEPEKAGCFNSSSSMSMSRLISVKELVVFKESNGEITDREVVLYFYVKDNPLATDTITMIRASAQAPINGSVDGTLNITKGFMGEAFPYMFEVREKEEIIAVKLAKSGIGGWLIIGVLISVPIGIAVYPRIKIRIKKRKARGIIR